MNDSHSIKDGGPAFPDPTGMYPNTKHGMSLRDYFAGRALGGLLADERVTVHDAKRRETLAANCYLIADAMLLERAK